jgi:hypothetical protein
MEKCARDSLCSERGMLDRPKTTPSNWPDDLRKRWPRKIEVKQWDIKNFNR